MLPTKIFFTGAPGSRWSAIAGEIETIPGFNTSDRTDQRVYWKSDKFATHQGSYFGRGWEFESDLDPANLSRPFVESGGTCVLKSHEWAYQLDNIVEQYPNDWIMLVYRPDLTSYAWWHEAGAFNITYPDYTKYLNNSQEMLMEITRINQCLLEFAGQHNLTWHHWNSTTAEKLFGHAVTVDNPYRDILVAVKQT